jgi:hypothetical protein
MEFYSAIEKNEIMPFFGNDGTGGHHVKWNKPVSQKQILLVSTHLWKLGEKNPRSWKVKDRLVGLWKGK